MQSRTLFDRLFARLSVVAHLFALLTFLHATYVQLHLLTCHSTHADTVQAHDNHDHAHPPAGEPDHHHHDGDLAGSRLFSSLIFVLPPSTLLAEPVRIESIARWLDPTVHIPPDPLRFQSGPARAPPSCA